MRSIKKIFWKKWKLWLSVLGLGAYFSMITGYSVLTHWQWGIAVPACAAVFLMTVAGQGPDDDDDN